MSLNLSQRDDGFFAERRSRAAFLLNGLINGVNTVFTTAPFTFQNDLAETIHVYLNGQRLIEVNDFSLSESGGLGTGYDTVTLVIAPRLGDEVLADFVITA